MNKLERVEVVMEGGPCGPELQVVNMTDGPFYYADEADKRIAELEAERDKYHDALNTAMTSFGELQAELEKKQQSTAMFKLGEKAGM